MSSNIDFVVSFKESDRAWAELIAQVLSGAGYHAELLSWAYKASRDMLAEVTRLGREGAVFVPVLTPAYMTTLHAEHYWFEAFREGLFPVMPVLARECDIDALLFIHSYVDIRDSTVDEARARVLGEALKHKSLPTGQRTRHTPPPSSIVTGTRIADLAPVRRVPFERAEPYVGGETLLRGLHSALNEHHFAVLLPHESGLGGFGRRKACIEYLYQFEQEYRLIWVVRANREAVLAEDFARLAQVVQLPEAGIRDLPYTVHAVRRWLSANPGWLLLFHDPADYATIAPYLPALSEGHVLVSAEGGAWREAKAVFHVTRWLDSQIDAYLRQLSDATPALSMEIGGLLYGYPLALTIATATAIDASWSAGELMERIRARDAALEPALKEHTPQRRALAVVLSLALSELWQDAPECVDLLRALVYLDPFNVLPGILVSGADVLPGELGRVLHNHHRAEAAIQKLRSAGLIEERFGSITVYPLVQEQLRGWMELGARGAVHAVHPGFSQARSFSLARAEGPLWARRMVRLMLHIFPTRPDFDRKWRQASKVVAHVYAVLEHAARLGVERGDCEQLWTRLGEYLLYREMLHPAAEALERALALENLPHLGGREGRYQLLRALGQVRSYQGRTEEACSHLVAGVKAAEQAHGRTSPEVSEMLIMLGNACRKAADPARALEAYEHAYEIDQQLHPGPHADLVRDLMMLGIARQEAGDWTGAWSILEKALGMQGLVHGPTHISLAQVSKCLARVYQDMGDLPQAQIYFRQSISVTESLHGAGHPALAEIYEGYGDVLYALRDVEAARRAYKCAFRIVEAVYGMQDHRLFECALKLGDTAMARGEPGKALMAYERAETLLNVIRHSEADHLRVQERIAQARGSLTRPASAAPH